ncbi:MAG: prephenate dehydrogenase/arogenate dehydrogenase family protein [Candidatus Poribacteria bacterium]|nr:prephenate dehydrogenase/arogenate dehydrogenase family protein [Candidatus Poribacteria bacterium]
MAKHLGGVEKFVLYGVGLINGSIGLALRARGFEGEIVGVGRREETLERAAERGAIDDYTTDERAGFADADIIVIGTPVDLIAQKVADAVEIAPNAVITDVGSVKASVVRECRRTAPTARFVGSHPIAGSEVAGVAGSKPDLFQRAVCVVTPVEETDAGALEIVKDLWETLGSNVVELSPEVHDQLLAASSHLPHVAASALTYAVASFETNGINARSLTGKGFGDTTRIAKCSTDVWEPIIRHNATALAPMVRRLAEELERIAHLIDEKDTASIRKWLSEARDLRAEMDK